MKRMPVMVFVLSVLCLVSSGAGAQENSASEILPPAFAPVILRNFGVEPQAPAARGSAPSVASYAVPGTNQTLCYNMSGVILCPDATSAYYGQDATYDVAPMGYSKVSLSGATYEVDSLSRYWSAPDTSRNWSDAQAYCASKTLSGKPMRLPTLLELSQLVDASRTDPAVNTDAFPNLRSIAYWTEDEQDATNAWVVNFNAGTTQTLAKGSLAGTMCVVGLQTFSGGLVDYGDGTIGDLEASLMWQKADSTTVMAWNTALVTCAQSQTGGYTDWRLPTKNQLQTIVDPDNSSLWPAVFTSHAGAYWTATTLASDPDMAWAVLSDKQSNVGGKTVSQRVRCVRDMAPAPAPSRQTIMSGTWTTTVNGAAVSTKLVNAPRLSRLEASGETTEMVLESLSTEVTVAGSPSYSYHAKGVAVTGLKDFNVMLTHDSTSGSSSFMGMASGTSVTGDLYDGGAKFAQVTANRTAKPNTMQDYDISGLWSGTALGTLVTADLRSATYTSGGQTVTYFNGLLSVPYGPTISPYSFTGFMDSDGTVFMIRNTTTKVYIFEGVRSGDTITGTLRNYDDELATNLVFTRLGGVTPQGGVALVPYTLLFE